MTSRYDLENGNLKVLAILLIYFGESLKFKLSANSSKFSVEY